MIQIKKVRANKNFNGLNIEYTEFGEKGLKEHSTQFGFKPMQSLIRSFSVLIPHLIIADESTDGELSELNPLITDAEVDPVCVKHKIKGFTISRKDNYTGVTLVGSKVLSTGHHRNFNSPTIQIEIEEGTASENAYKYHAELTEDIHNALAEIVSYINGNYSSLKQGELNFEKEEDSEEEEVPVKKKGKKLAA